MPRCGWHKSHLGTIPLLNPNYQNGDPAPEVSGGIVWICEKAQKEREKQHATLETNRKRPYAKLPDA